MDTPNRAWLLAQLDAHQATLRRFGVKRCGIFGSYAREEENETSDIDILVEFLPGEKSFNNFMALAEFLEELFGRPVDLVTPESLSPYIGPYILNQVEYASFAA